MSQVDFDIATGDANTGITFRAAVNAALQALASMNSGASAPTVAYPFQIYINTTDVPAGAYIRNAANTAWVKFGYVDAGTGKLMVFNADAAPWTGITGKPATFPPDAHNHDASYTSPLHDHDGGDGAQINTGGLVDNAVSGAKIKKTGSLIAMQYVGQGGSWTPLAGVYTVVARTSDSDPVIFEIYIPSELVWVGSNTGVGVRGVFFCDGSNMRFRNTGIGTKTLNYYQH